METLLNQSSAGNKRATWNDSYKINIPHIDSQHRVFFDIYDELLSYRESAEPYEKINMTITRLLDYASDHFRTEESLMMLAEFQGIESHTRHHRFFEKKINEFRLACSYKNPMLLSQVILFIRKWFLSHISQIDYLFKNDVSRFLQSAGI